MLMTVPVLIPILMLVLMLVPVLMIILMLVTAVAAAKLRLRYVCYGVGHRVYIILESPQAPLLLNAPVLAGWWVGGRVGI